MMTRGERAKQFAPFDAMKGLQEALRDREERHSRVEKREISEEMAEQNERVIRRLTRGMTVEVYCYCAFHDVTRRGTVTDIDLTFRHLTLDPIHDLAHDPTRIWFDDIYAIAILDEG